MRARGLTPLAIVAALLATAGAEEAVRSWPATATEHMAVERLAERRQELLKAEERWQSDYAAVMSDVNARLKLAPDTKLRMGKNGSWEK